MVSGGHCGLSRYNIARKKEEEKGKEKVAQREAGAENHCMVRVRLGERKSATQNENSSFV